MPAKARRPAKRPKAATVDAYLAQVDAPARAALRRMRAQIRQAAPMAREVISYQIPTYLHHGPVVHFAAQPRHLALYVTSPDVLRQVADELEPFEVAGRTVRFTASKPLPAALVKRIVKARVVENEARHKR